MSHTSTHDDQFVLAREAAKRVSLSRDYVTRLAREGRIEAKRVGNAWYVSIVSLESFCTHQGTVRTRQHHSLAEKRREEYRGHGEESVVVEEAAITESAEPVEHKPASATVSMRAAVHDLAKKHVRHVQTAPLYAMSPMLDLLHRATALMGALALVAGAYAFLYPEPLRIAGGVAREVMLGAAAAISSAHNTSF